MSYLLQYARRPARSRALDAARVDEYVRLNRPGLYGDAFVRVFVEDTTARRRRRNRGRRGSCSQIADCVNTINLEFSLDSPELRENSLFKIDTLLETLHRFRDGSRRARRSSREQPRPTHTSEKGGATMSYLKRHGTRRVPQWAPLPGQVANSAGGFAWAVDDWTRLRRFLILGSEGGCYYASRVEADARERAGGRAAASREDGARAVAEIVASRARAGRRRTTRRSSRSRWRRASATRRRAGRRSRRCRRWPARARTCSSSRRSSRASAAGAARCVARSARWYAAQPVDALAYQAVKYRQREGVTHRDLLRLAHPARARRRGQPDARRLGRARSPVRVDRPRRRRPTACRAWSRASPAPRRRRPPREAAAARPRVRPAARGAPAGAPDLARGLGGAARGHADDGARSATSRR